MIKVEVKPRKSTRRLDLSGKKFGRLTAIRYSATYRTPGGKSYRKWLCKCDCGKECEVMVGSLRSGHASSCGCYAKEMYSAGPFRHGMYQHSFYKQWAGMKARCHGHPGEEAWRSYGGRGITVCDRWHNFQNFYEDMFSSWRRGLTIERIDVNGNYCPENCEWIPGAMQARNTRRAKFIEFNGKRLCLSEWARELDMPLPTIVQRLNRGLPAHLILCKSPICRTSHPENPQLPPSTHTPTA